jgi:hypothetical protein
MKYLGGGTGTAHFLDRGGPGMAFFEEQSAWRSGSPTAAPWETVERFLRTAFVTATRFHRAGVAAREGKTKAPANEGGCVVFYDQSGDTLSGLLTPHGHL